MKFCIDRTDRYVPIDRVVDFFETIKQKTIQAVKPEKPLGAFQG